MTLRSSRTFPGQEYPRKIFSTTEPPLLLHAQITNLAPESAGLDPVADGDLEFAEPDRFGYEIVGAAAQRRDRVFELDITRDHNHDGLRLALLVFEQGVESGSVRQIDVLQHRRGPLCVEGLQRRGHRRGFERVVSPSAQRFGQREANRRVVINHQHFLFWHNHASLKYISAILLRIDVIRQSSVVADSRLPMYSVPNLIEFESNNFINVFLPRIVAICKEGGIQRRCVSCTSFLCFS